MLLLLEEVQKGSVCGHLIRFLDDSIFFSKGREGKVRRPGTYVRRPEVAEHCCFLCCEERLDRRRPRRRP
jgi:hypothetical protein